MSGCGMQKSWRAAVVLVLSLIGIGLSTYLTYIHFRHLFSGTASVCNFGAQLDCDAVNTSPYSELFGVPVSHFGLLFYLLTTGLSGYALMRPELRERLYAYLFGFSTIAVGFSVYLALISGMVLHTFCLFCIGLYVVSFALLFVLLGPGVGGLRRLSLGADLGALVRPPGVLFLLLFLGAAVASVVSVRKTSVKAHEAAEERDGQARFDLVVPGLPMIGAADAPVTIVEISDFECPFCQRAAETIDEVLKLYPGKVRILFRNFPLDKKCNPLLKEQIHENACAAAQAALCANRQGKFEPFVKRLWSGATTPSELDEHGRALGLDEAQYQACRKDLTVTSAIATEIWNLSEKGNITGVPVFYINGRRLAGARPLADFRLLIDRALNEAKPPAAPEKK